MPIQFINNFIIITNNTNEKSETFNKQIAVLSLESDIFQINKMRIIIQ